MATFDSFWDQHKEEYPGLNPSIAAGIDSAKQWAFQNNVPLQVTETVRPADQLPPGGSPTSEHYTGDAADLAWNGLQWGDKNFNGIADHLESQGYNVIRDPHGTGPHVHFSGGGQKPNGPTTFDSFFDNNFAPEPVAVEPAEPGVTMGQLRDIEKGQQGPSSGDENAGTVKSILKNLPFVGPLASIAPTSFINDASTKIARFASNAGTNIENVKPTTYGVDAQGNVIQNPAETMSDMPEQFNAQRQEAAQKLLDETVKPVVYPMALAGVPGAGAIAAPLFVSDITRSLGEKSREEVAAGGTVPGAIASAATGTVADFTPFLRMGQEIAKDPAAWMDTAAKNPASTVYDVGMNALMAYMIGKGFKPKKGEGLVAEKPLSLREVIDQAKSEGFMNEADMQAANTITRTLSDVVGNKKHMVNPTPAELDAAILHVVKQTSLQKFWDKAPKEDGSTGLTFNEFWEKSHRPAVDTVERIPGELAKTEPITPKEIIVPENIRPVQPVTTTPIPASYPLSAEMVLERNRGTGPVETMTRGNQLYGGLSGVDKLSEKFFSKIKPSVLTKSKETNRLLSSIGKEEPPTIGAKVKEFFSKVEERAFDDMGPAEAVKRQVEAEAGRKLTAEEDFVLKMRHATPQAVGEAKMLLFGKDPSYQMPANTEAALSAIEGNRGIKLERATYADMLALLKDTRDKDLLDAYSVAKQIPAVMREHPKMKIVAPDGQPITLQESLATQRFVEANHPNVAEAHGKLMQVARNKMKLDVNDQIVSQETADMLQKKYPDYIPFYREMGNIEAETHFAKGGGYFNIPSTIQAYVGSNQKILPPTESLAMNILRDRGRGNRNQAALSILKQAESHPWLAQREGMTTVEGEPSQMAGKYKPKSGEKAFQAWVDGEKYTFSTSSEIYNAFQRMAPADMNIIGQVLHAPMSMLRAGATGLNPEFFVKNIIRDALQGVVTSRGFTPFVDTAKGLKKAVTADQSFYDYLASGGGMDTILTADRMDMSSRIKSLIKDNGGNGKYLRGVTDLLGTLSNYSEMSTRLGAYNEAMNRTGSRAEAVKAGRNVSIDFARGGTWAKEINQVVPFFNAALQGSVKTYKYAKSDPAAFVRKGIAYITIPSLVLQAMFGEDERIKDLPQWRKDMFWNIPHGNSVVSLPKPPGLGFLFGTIPERTLDFYKSQDPKIAKQLGSSFVRDAMPSLSFPGIQQAFEWSANYNYFQDRPIVPQKLQNLPPEMQFTPQTSEVAKGIGKVTGTSPMKIDNTIRGMTGGLGRIVTDVIDIPLKDKNAPAKAWQETPIIRSMVNVAGKSSQSVNDFWDRYQEVSTKMNGWKAGGQKPTVQEQKDFARLSSVSKELKAISDAEKKTESSKLSPEKKREILDGLQNKYQAVTRKAMGK